MTKRFFKAWFGSQLMRECWATHYAIVMDTEIFEKLLSEGHYTKVEYWDVVNDKPTSLQSLPTK